MSSSLKLDWCSHEAAKYATARWHYTGKMPVNKTAKIGVWEGGFVGAIVFSCGTSAPMHQRYALNRFELAELSRIALRSHTAPVSKMISVAVRLLRQRCPGLKLLVSFADPTEGHTGAIYQASNWVYTGKSTPTTEYYANGDWRQKTDVYKRYKRTAIRAMPARQRPGKFRYVKPLTQALAERVGGWARPYPKRVGSDTSDTAAIHAAEGRAALTPTLVGAA